MIVLGLDVSMTATGWVVVKLDNGTDAPTLLAAGCIPTEKLEGGEDVSNTVDSMRRAAKIHDALQHAVFSKQHYQGKIDLVVVEAMSWPRNAGAAIKMAMAWGAIAPLVSSYPIIEVLPQALKLAVAGSKSATKAEVEAGVKKWLPAEGITLLEASVSKRAQREHPWDALGAILASLRTEKYRLLRAGMRRR